MKQKLDSTCFAAKISKNCYNPLISLTILLAGRIVVAAIYLHLPAKWKSIQNSFGFKRINKR